MNSKPKIIVLRMRELIYTALLLCLAVLLAVCLYFMFAPAGREESRRSSSHTGSEAATDQETSLGTDLAVTASPKASSGARYTAGVYTAPVSLGSASAQVEVTVDSDKILSVRLVQLDETAEAMYPLAAPSMEHIAGQIVETQKLESITCPQEEKYTSQLLLNAVSDALSLARSASITYPLK